ncbi:MAG: transposase [Patescibacteria group bacterium]|nr:transposase [Patescibacteria group bacterium]
MSIRERLYPEDGQAQVLVRHCADARYVWNLGLEQRSFWRRGMPSISVYDQKRSLTEARQGTWLGEGSSVVQQQALFDLDRAFRNWWKNPGHFSRPTWRKVGVNEGFAVRDPSVRRINRRWGEALVPKCGWVRFRVTRQWADICAGTSARVTCDRAGRWHVSFTAPPPALCRQPTGAVVGLDMGVVATVTTSGGGRLRIPKLLSPGEAQRKRRLQRKLARQEKGSKRRARTRHQIAVLSARETDRRKDWIEKTTTDLVRGYDIICVEDLAVKNMVRSAKGTVDSPGRNVRQKAGLNRSISSQAWGLFRRRLCDKAAHATEPNGTPGPVLLVAVNPAYTSQRCSACGHTAPENRESQAVFRCRSCGYCANADVNAASNILAAGLAVTGRGGTPHGQPATAARSGPAKRQPPGLEAA